MCVCSEPQDGPKWLEGESYTTHQVYCSFVATKGSVMLATGAHWRRYGAKPRPCEIPGTLPKHALNCDGLFSREMRDTEEED